MNENSWLCPCGEWNRPDASHYEECGLKEEGNHQMWTPDGFVCPHCGTSNPDGHNKCGNCDQNPYVMPPADAKLTKEQLLILRAATRRFVLT